MTGTLPATYPRDALPLNLLQEKGISSLLDGYLLLIEYNNYTLVY